MYLTGRLSGNNHDYMALPGLVGKPRLHIQRYSNADYIEDCVAQFFRYSTEELRSKRREYPIAKARMIAMYLIRTYAGDTLVAIAKRFNRDHTTVIHAVRTVRNYMETDDRVREEVKGLEIKVQ